MNRAYSALVVAAILTLSGCPFQVNYSIGGTVTGLIGSGLVLQDNGGSDLTVTANGTFTFRDRVANTDAFTVTIATQPSNPVQTCTVRNGSGTIEKASITNVIVSCTQAARFAYVTNQMSNTVSAYVIDSTSGLLTPAAGSPFSSIGTTPVALQVDPNGTYLYVADNSSNTLSSYSIDSVSGALTPLNFSVVTGTSPVAIAMHPAGTFLYVGASKLWQQQRVRLFSVENSVAAA